jgi:uncharacterized protein (TIRG00374 family)
LSENISSEEATNELGEVKTITNPSIINKENEKQQTIENSNTPEEKEEKKKGFFSKLFEILWRGLRNNWKTILGVVITLGLMSFLIWKCEPRKVWLGLVEANKWLLLASFGCTLVLFVIKTLRWQAILRPHEIKHPFFKTLVLIIIGTFGSAITPAKVGDILRAFYLSRDNENAPVGKAVFSVVFDRIFDLGAIFLLIGVSFPFILLEITTLNWWIPAGIIAGFLVFLIVIVFTFSEKITKPILTFILKIISKMFKKKKAKEKIQITTEEIIEDFFTGQKSYRFYHYLIFSFYSILFWGILGVQGSIILTSFGISFPNIGIIIAVLCTAAITAMALPISISGTGVREAVIILLLWLFLGIEEAFSLDLSIIQTTLNVLLPGLIGGIMVLVINRKEKQLVSKISD